MKKIIFGLALSAALAANAQMGATKATQLPKKSMKTTARAAAAKQLAKNSPVIVAPVVAANDAALEARASSQTSTATVAAVAPTAAKKWSASLVTDNSAGVASNAKDGKYETRAQNLNILSLNYVGLKYKLTDNSYASAQQFFSYKKQGNDSADQQESVSAYVTRLVYGMQKNTVAGSDEFEIPVRLVIPDSTTANTSGLRYALNSPIEIGWTLSPKVTVSYLLYPRISVYANSETSAFKLQNGPIAYYNVTDKVQPYAAINMDSQFTKLSALTKSSDSWELEAGVNLTLPAKIMLTPAIGQSHSLTAGGLDLGKADETSYKLQAGVTF